MRTVFVNGEIERYLESRDALVERFRAGLPADHTGIAEIAPLVVRGMLDDKLTRDGLLARWSEADVEHVLVEVVPRRMSVEGGWSAVPRAVHRWLDFLAEAGLLVVAPGSSAEALHAAVDRVVPAFEAAMADPAEWGSAKFWSTTMLEHGVDLSDESAVDRFFERVDEGDVRVDEDALDVIEDREEAEPDPLPARWLAPLDEPSAAVLAEELDGNELVGGVRELLDWVGSGRELDGAGRLGEADRRELSRVLGRDGEVVSAELLLEWARRARLVTDVGRCLVRTRVSAPLLAEPRLLWEQLWRAFAQLDEPVSEGVEGLGRFGAVPEVFGHAVTSALRMLYSGRDAFPLEMVVSAVVAGLSPDEGEGPSAGEYEAVRELLRRACELWELMGAVRVSDGADVGVAEVVGSLVPDGVSAESALVELLPLGLVGARRSLVSAGYVAPSMSEVGGFSAEVAVCVAARCPVEIGERVAASWVEARGVADAGVELAALLRRVDDPLVRSTAVSFLDSVGSDGVSAVRGLVDDPVAGPAARVWLRGHPDGDADVLRPGDELLVELDSMVLAVEDGPEEFLEQLRLGSTTEQVAMVEEIAGAPHARKGAVLEVIASGHPDARVSGVARRSLERAVDG